MEIMLLEPLEILTQSMKQAFESLCFEFISRAVASFSNTKPRPMQILTQMIKTIESRNKKALHLNFSCN